VNGGTGAHPPARGFTPSRVAIAVIALVPTAIYLSVALRRVAYPYELEWLEGGAVEIVRRVAHGQSIYPSPSLHFVPYPYTPLYFWVSGGLAKLTGVSFFTLRLVSLLSSLGACVMLLRIVWRETGDVVAGVVSTGLFTATFAVSGAWLDIGRVDSLALLLVLMSLYWARRAEGIHGGVLVGTLIFVAFMAKQTGVIALAPLVVLLIITRRRVGLSALATTAVLIVGSTFVLDATTHGWYGYYVFQELIHQGAVPSVWRTFFTKDLWHTPWAIGLGLFAIVTTLLYRKGSSTDWLYWSVAIVGLLASSLVSRLHSGGGPDVLIPAFAGMALLGAFGYSTLLDLATRIGSRSDATSGRPSFAVAVASSVLVIVVGVQIAALHYNSSRFVPTAADRAAGESFIQLVRHTPGPVIVADHPFYETLAGKTSWAQGEAVHDILRAGPSPARQDLLASIDAELHSAQPVTIFSDSSTSALGVISEPFFRLTSTQIFKCGGCFYPVTDVRTRPAYRYVRQ
jgi:hypothetical protein